MVFNNELWLLTRLLQHIWTRGMLDYGRVVWVGLIKKTPMTLAVVQQKLDMFKARRRSFDFFRMYG